MGKLISLFFLSLNISNNLFYQDSQELTDILVDLDS